MPAPEPKAIVTLMINKRAVEVECSICHEVIIAKPGPRPDEDQESAIRDAIRRHATSRHRG
jgi:hypothetical protein